MINRALAPDAGCRRPAVGDEHLMMPWEILKSSPS